MKAERFEPVPGLFLFDLPQPLAGFRRFISAWFFVDALGRRVVVDPGPANTIPLLLEALETVTDGVDLVLLTHIHLDHSGGLGAFCARHPKVKVLVHRKAVRHLTRPEKLWKASLANLGEIARAYTEPTPVAEDLLVFEDDAGLVEVLETPGHASHHLIFRVSCGERRLFFVGEAAGLSLPTEDGREWLRPTTPPRFDAAAALQSLDAMEHFCAGDELLCYAHWGVAEEPLGRLAWAKRQIREWLDVVRSRRDETPEAIAEYLMRTDSLMRARLPEDLLARERIFVANSVRGFLGFLESESGQGKAS